jgi:hypothetical protein
MLRFVFFSLALLAIPVFVGATDGAVSLMHFFGREFDEDGFCVNINIIVPLFGIVVLLFSQRLPRLLVGYVAFIVAWLTLSLVAGLLEEPSVYNVVFYIQTVLPLFAIFAGYVMVPQSRDLDAVCKLLSLSMIIFIGFLWFIVLSEFSLGTFLYDRNVVMKYVAAGIPQFRNYFPASAVVVFNIALAKYIFDDSKNQEVHTFALLALFLFFPLCWSRTALLGFSLSLVVQIGMAMLYGQSRAWNKSLVFIVAAAFLLPLVLAKFGSTVSSRAGDATVDSDMRRLQLFKDGLNQSLHYPMFGDKFVPKADVLAGGQEVLIKRLFPAHNQYIDFLLRGGYPFLLAFLALMMDVFCTSFYGVRLGQAQGRGDTVALCAAVFTIYCAYAIGANFQLYFIQLQSAVPCFFMTGVMFRTVHRARQEGLPSPRHKRRSTERRTAQLRKRPVSRRGRSLPSPSVHRPRTATPRRS